LIKAFLSILLLLTSIEARENPFFPSKGEKDITYSSNEDRSLSPLKRSTITLPTYARVIESVTINYKNLDGSQESKTLELGNSIDWHLPVFISQSYGPMAKRPLRKKSKKKFKKIASTSQVSFFSSGETLQIKTDDKIIRNFLLVKPHRIVLDFDKDTSLKSFVKSIPKNVFSKIRVGNHDKYYRVVIELDGYYKYSMKKSSFGYIFDLK